MILGGGNRRTQMVTRAAVQNRMHPAYHHHPRSRVIMPPRPTAPVYLVVLPFAMSEAQLPEGVAVWAGDGVDFHDPVGSGTEVLLLFAVIVACGWHMIRLVAVRESDQPGLVEPPPLP